MSTSGFEIWDSESNNLVAHFATESEALAMIRDAIRRHGAACVEPLVLLRVGPRGGLSAVASGTALAERAAVSAMERDPVTT